MPDNINDLLNYGTPQRIYKLHKVLAKRQKSLTIVLENVADPHNLSACLRSCDAVGVFEVCLVYHSGQHFPNTYSTSSASANKWIECRFFDSVSECFDTLHAENKKIFTTKLEHSSTSLYDLDLTQDVALVFGNEHAGVSEEAVTLADGNFLIPQIGVIQSLNISVACAVSLFEAMRQRNCQDMLDIQELSDPEIDVKLKEWLLK